jgi:hypothetical protein
MPGRKKLSAREQHKRHIRNEQTALRIIQDMVRQREGLKQALKDLLNYWDGRFGGPQGWIAADIERIEEIRRMIQ